MEKIKVGEYVRTKEGIIDKVKDFSNDTSFYHCENGMIIDVYSKCATYLKDIVKHSYNIIDLIEVGDIVELSDVLNKDILYVWSKRMIKIMKEDIENGIQLKTILTKEQYESMSYKVGE